MALPTITIPAIVVLMVHRHDLPPEQRHKFTVLISANIMLLIMGSPTSFPSSASPATRARTCGFCRWGSLSPESTAWPWPTASSRTSSSTSDASRSGRFAVTLVRLLFLVGVAFLILFLGAAFTGDFTMLAFTVAIFAAPPPPSSPMIYFPKLLGRASERLEQRLLGDHFEYQEQLHAFGDNMAIYNDQPALLEDLMAILTRSMRINAAHAAVFDSRTGTRQFGASRPQKLALQISEKVDTVVCDYFGGPATRPSTCATGPPTTLPAWRAPRPGATCARWGPTTPSPWAAGAMSSATWPSGPRRSGRPSPCSTSSYLEDLVTQLSQALDRLVLVERAQFAEKMELMAVMSRGLAHDLNNCITPVMTYLQLLGIQNSRDSGEEQLHQTAIEKMEVMRRYISEAIFFAQTLTPKYARAGLASIVEAAREVAAGRCDRAGVTVDTAGVEDLLVIADGILLQRMTANLISNSADASKPGGRIWIKASELSVPTQRGPWFRLQVVDEGHGIEPEQLGKVFEPYYSTRDAGDGARASASA